MVINRLNDIIWAITRISMEDFVKLSRRMSDKNVIDKPIIEIDFICLLYTLCMVNLFLPLIFLVQSRFCVCVDFDQDIRLDSKWDHIRRKKVPK